MHEHVNESGALAAQEKDNADGDEAFSSRSSACRNIRVGIGSAKEEFEIEVAKVGGVIGEPNMFVDDEFECNPGQTNCFLDFEPGSLRTMIEEGADLG